MKKNAIITGASGGIGTAIAEAMAKKKYNLILIGNNSLDALEKTATACRNLPEPPDFVHTLSGDLGDGPRASSLIEKAVGLLGHVDLLVNCAGVSYIGLLTDMSDREWNTVIQTNLSSAFYCCRSVLPDMIHRKEGRILNISSVWGETGASCEAAYSASKGGLNALTKELAKEVAPSGIAVNALACGMIDTPMNRCFSEEEIKEICEEIPAGRMGTTEEAAQMALLLSEAPLYLTGQVITMDGGWT